MRIFNTALDLAFRIAYPENATIPVREFRQLHLEEGVARLAEELILFGSVSLQIAGENGALPLLVHHVGVKEVERLLDDQVIEFVLNPTMLVFPVQTHHLQPPLIRAVRNDAIYHDPDASLERGFERTTVGSQIGETNRRNLVRKARDLYKSPDQRAGSNAVEMALEAYEKGFFTEFGLEPKDWKDITLQEREKLSKFGEDLFEFGIISQFQYGTLNKPRTDRMLDNAFRLAKQAREIQGAFNEIGKFEHIPDIHGLVIAKKLSIREAVALSQSKEGRNFQEWIEGATKDSEASKVVTKQYVDAIEAKGQFFRSTPGKFVKVLGTFGLTDLVLKPLNLPPGASETIAAGIGILLEFVSDSLFRGWNPRIFVDRLRERMETPK